MVGPSQIRSNRIKPNQTKSNLRGGRAYGTRSCMRAEWGKTRLKDEAPRRRYSRSVKAGQAGSNRRGDGSGKWQVLVASGWRRRRPAQHSAVKPSQTESNLWGLDKDESMKEETSWRHGQTQSNRIKPNQTKSNLRGGSTYGTRSCMRAEWGKTRLKDEAARRGYSRSVKPDQTGSSRIKPNQTKSNL
jgi:hypothetical protein